MVKRAFQGVCSLMPGPFGFGVLRNFSSRYPQEIFWDSSDVLIIIDNKIAPHAFT